MGPCPLHSRSNRSPNGDGCGVRFSRRLLQLGLPALVAVAMVLSIACALDPAFRKAKEGNAKLMEGELDGAIEAYDAAIQADPELSEAYNNRGLAYAHKGGL